MTKPRRIGTQCEVRRREAQAQRIQHAVGPASEITRLSARINELERQLALSQITIRSLRRQLEDLECEDGGPGS
jgi:hypothetical protein